MSLFPERTIYSTVGVSPSQETAMQTLNLSENLIGTAAVDSYTNNHETTTGWLSNMWDGTTATTFEVKDAAESTTTTSTVVFDLGIKRQIKSLLFEHYLNGAGANNTAELKVEYSNDNASWTTLFTENATDVSANYHSFYKDKAFRYLRLSMKSITDGVGYSEIKIYQIFLTG